MSCDVDDVEFSTPTSVCVHGCCTVVLCRCVILCFFTVTMSLHCCSCTKRSRPGSHGALTFVSYSASAMVHGRRIWSTVNAVNVFLDQVSTRQGHMLPDGIELEPSV